MPIAVLSEDTSRAISSTLVLNDAVSVVKELLDNALDSRATNITIEVSANTLDIIQLKDNGAGIGVEDRQLLCKRNHTSKIRTIEDLAYIGGSSLGFRGEALASIAELSESVLFTTRVDGESVASSMKFDSKGKLVSSFSASHSTGTTVRVSNFLKNIPVRRQTTLKDSQRVLSNIKKLLFDYAFARPTLRFQFRVLKSQSNLKHNWSYVACRDADSLSLIASKIVGKDIAAQCTQHSITSDDGALTIDALMIVAECDPSKLVPSAKYISIDGRPVTADHGSMSDLSKKYKTYLRHAVPELSNQSRPFLYLRLSCPRGFYDVNIEPAKDQVLFEDSSTVLNLFDELCKNVYGEPNIDVCSKNKSYRPVGKAGNHEFDILLAKKPADGVARGKPNEGNEIEEGSIYKQISSETIRDRHDSCDNNSLPDAVLRSESQQIALISRKDTIPGDPSSSEIGNINSEDQEDSMSPLIRNPFVLAKLNTRVRPQNLSLIHQAPEQRKTDNSMLDCNASDVRTTHEAAAQKSTMPTFMPSPSVSPERNVPYQNPGPPNRPWRRRHERDEDNDTQFDLNSARTPETPKTTLLDKWAQIVQSSSSPTDLLTPIRVEGIRSSGGVHGKLPGAVKDFGSTTTLRIPVAKVQQSSLLSHENAGLPLSLEEHETTVSPLLRSAGSSRVSPSSDNSNAKHALPAARLSNLRHDSAAELDDIMDFEHRKRHTIQRHRGFGKSTKDLKRKQPAETEIETYFSLPDSGITTERTLDANPDHALRFSSAREVDDNIPEQPHSASYTQNPHWNRYRKAVRDLEERRSDITRDLPESGIFSQANKTAGEESHLKSQTELRNRSLMSTHDPRAFLIRNPDVSKAGDQSKKQSAAKIAKLPFETIPPGQATYMLSASWEPRLEYWDNSKILKLATTVSHVDPYIRSGNTMPALCSKSIPAAATLTTWEATCRRLTQAKILPKFNDATLEKQITSDFEINLSTTLKTHFK